MCIDCYELRLGKNLLAWDPIAAILTTVSTGHTAKSVYHNIVIIMHNLILVGKRTDLCSGQPAALPW